jgi:hypothetical protein
MASRYLKRYVDISALVYLLRKRALTLVSPDSWDDSNDSYYMTLYREKLNLGSVLAACFTEAEETYHHWRVFAGGTGGACIWFLGEKLRPILRKEPGVRGKKVDYMTIRALEDRPPIIRELPFLKRLAYEHENEYRVIWESDEVEATYDISIPLTSIDRIVLSPWMHRSLYLEVKALLKSIPGCGGLKILRSTLIGNDDWKAFGDAAT